MVIVAPQVVGDQAEDQQRGRLPSDDRSDQPLALGLGQHRHFIADLLFAEGAPVRDLFFERAAVELVVTKQ
ncbi:hypothetical protein D3C80_1886220 [compost metagenome]